MSSSAAYFSMDWKGHAARLAAVATPPGSRWRGPVETVPSHPFIPRWWAWSDSDDGWVLRDGPSDPEAWMAAAYRDQTLVTRVGPLHADHGIPGSVMQGRPTSSSTLPGLVVQMYRHASIGERSTILDVGTGSAYGTAILCARVGAARVTAIDVDDHLNQAGRERLAQLNLRPQVIT